MPNEYIPLSPQCCFKLFDSLVDSIVVFDSNGEQVYCNFAVIFSEYSEEFTEQLKQRINEITVRVSEELSYTVGASVGFSSLSEVNGDVVRWASLADERMYEAKKLKAVKSYTDV